MEKKTLGVVLATFNGEKYIEQQLLSLANQTLRPDMIVISDANSKDSTIDIARRVLDKINIEYKILTSDKQLSVRENFQKALENIDTYYIFFCDQDDVWVNNKIEITIHYMKKFKAVLAFTNARLVDANLNSTKRDNLWERIQYNVTYEYQYYKENDNTFISELLKHNVVTGMCMCITNELKAFILPFSIHGIHDSWIALNAISHGNVIAINKKLVLYRQHELNVIGANNSGINKKIEKSKKYVSNIKNRLELIKDWKFKNCICQDEVDKYIDFLAFRLDLIEKNEKLFSIVMELRMYKKYEVRSTSIILKDSIMRVLNK